MKKISDFLVKSRYILLAVMLAAAVICVILSMHVPIQKDRSNYLSDSSEMKHGLAIMNNVFPGAQEQSSIRVMFDNLDECQIQSVIQQLELTEGVSSVNYEAGIEKYNKDNHTLFVVNSTYKYQTEEEKALESAIIDKFADYEMQLRNNDIPSTDVPMWVIASAVAIAVAVLLVMSSSWLEPPLLLITIGVGIVINLGTNIILPYTDELTVSVGPIIQLVLSMDYSIILLNCYRSEKKKQPEKKTAMKTALAGAIPSVISSSLTTAVGLLALVFLSFKLGPELGIVLAKGVLISMICVFTVLPALVLLLDRAIEKTEKKVFHLPMVALARFSFRSRFAVLAVFVVLFGVFSFLQSKTAITFTERNDDPMIDIFPKDNTVVLLYNNGDEKNIADMIEEIEKDALITDITGYENTLGKAMTAKEISAALNSMGGESPLGPGTVGLIYAASENKKDIRVGAKEFLTFISDKILTNDEFSGFLNDNIKKQSDKLKLFSSKETLLVKVDPREIAMIFDTDENDASLLFLYHTMQTGVADSGKMTLAEFSGFLVDTVAKDENFSKMIDKDTLASAERLKNFTDIKYITEKRTSASLSHALGIQESEADSIFTLYRLENTGSRELSIKETVDFILSKSLVKNRLTDEQVSQLEMLQSVMRESIDGTSFTASQLADLLGVQPEQTEQMFILHLYNSGELETDRLSPSEFIDFAANKVLTNPDFKEMFDKDTADKLTGAEILTKAVISDKKYTSGEMYALLESLTDLLSENMVDLLFRYYSFVSEGSKVKMTIPEFFSFVSDNIIAEPAFADFFSEKDKAAVKDGGEQLSAGIAQLKSNEYSRLIITSSYKDESPETLAFIDRLNTLRHEKLGESYLIGNSVIISEMNSTFRHENIIISLITAIAIFLVVLIAFRRPIIPLLLTLTVQCGVFITVSFIGARSGSIYYLALLIVQSILMGASIDYGIVFCSCYREFRKNCDIITSLKNAYEDSIHTILTSGLILIIVLSAVGSFVSSVMISEVCITLAIGVFIAVMLILFLLPGMVVCFDRLITKCQKGGD